MTGPNDRPFTREFLESVTRYVVQYRQPTGVALRRRFHIGQAKAARLLQVLEAHGVVGPHQEGQAREILVDRSQLTEVLASLPGEPQ